MNIVISRSKYRDSDTNTFLHLSRRECTVVGVDVGSLALIISFDRTVGEKVNTGTKM